MLDPAQRFQAVHFQQADIHHNQVERIGCEQLQGCFRRSRGSHLVTAAAEEVLERRKHTGFVVHHENLAHVASPGAAGI